MKDRIERAARTRRRIQRLRRHLPWLAALAAYVGSRIFYGHLGLELDARPLDYFWQYQDPVELRENLWEAVFYQHTQPPLYNLFLGLGLKLPDPLRFFRVAAIGFGLVLHLGIYGVSRQLGVRGWLAAIGVLLFALNPASILMETWLFYTYPVAALVVLGGFFLYRALAYERAVDIAIAFTVLALVVLTRSLFHIAWMVVIAIIAVAIARHRVRMLLALALPVLLAASVYIKNGVVFGRPVASTWLGFSLSRLTTTKLDPSERRRLMHEGVLGELGGHSPWLPLEHYPRELRELPEDIPHVRVLTETRRTGGHPNFNHGAYVRIADEFAHDARVVLERHPEVWWQSTKEAWQHHFLPIHDYTFFHARRRAAGEWMRRIERVYEASAGSVAFARWSWEEPMPPFADRPGWAWAIVTALALLLAIGRASRSPGRARAMVLLYCVLTIAFVAIVGNSLELGENHRFRFLTEPLTYCLVALVFESILRSMRRSS